LVAIEKINCRVVDDFTNLEKEKGIQVTKLLSGMTLAMA
jgi:hypothetical protein